MNELPALSQVFQRFGIALAIGFIIGVERERDRGGLFAGIRTFPLIAMFGCLAALVNSVFIPWAFLVALLIVAAVVVTSYKVTATPASPGITTEMSVLLVFCYGALTWWGQGVLAAGLAVTTVLLLHAKEPLQQLSKRLGQHELAAAIQFGVISVIVLPLLPDRSFGPLDVLNPRKIWLMVVLIVALNLTGYVLVKIRGSKQGLGLAAFMGGLLSSTALTLSYSRRSRNEQVYVPLFAFGIILACSIMFIRILILTYAISPAVGRILGYPMATAGLVGLAACLVLWYVQHKKLRDTEANHELEIKNPCELGFAMRFGVLFALILFVSKGAQVLIGTPGVYVSSALSGMADVDAITLSLASLAKETLSPEVAARGITLAAVCNTLVKAAIAAVAGTASLRRYTNPAFAVITVTALAVAFILLR